MESIGKSLLSLCGFLLTATALSLLLPQLPHGTGRAVRLFTALAVLLLILTPFAGFLRTDPQIAWGAVIEEPDEAAYEAVFLETVDARGALTLADGLAALVCAEFDLPDDAVCVRVTAGADGAPESVSVRLSGKGLLCDPDKIADFLRQKLDCTVEVR